MKPVLDPARVRELEAEGGGVAARGRRGQRQIQRVERRVQALGGQGEVQRRRHLGGGGRGGARVQHRERGRDAGLREDEVAGLLRAQPLVHVDRKRQVVGGKLGRVGVADRGVGHADLVGAQVRASEPARGSDAPQAASSAGTAMSGGAG